MASDETVSRIKEAIVRLHTGRLTPRPATNAEVIAAAGVSAKSFYRVKQAHPEVVDLLEDVRAVYSGRQRGDSRSDADSLKELEAAKEQLLVVVAALANVIEEQRVRIDELERSLAMAVDPRLVDHPAPPSLATARARRRKDLP